jgi:hypothetical protein
MPELCEVIGGTKTKIYCQLTICWTCIIAVPWSIKVGLAKVGSQAKPLKYSEENCILYKFRAVVQVYSHRPRYTADDDAAEIDEIDMSTQKCQVAA